MYVSVYLSIRARAACPPTLSPFSFSFCLVSLLLSSLSFVHFTLSSFHSPPSFRIPPFSAHSTHSGHPLSPPFLSLFQPPPRRARTFSALSQIFVQNHCSLLSLVLFRSRRRGSFSFSSSVSLVLCFPHPSNPSDRCAVGRFRKRKEARPSAAGGGGGDVHSRSFVPCLQPHSFSRSLDPFSCQSTSLSFLFPLIVVLIPFHCISILVWFGQRSVRPSVLPMIPTATSRAHCTLEHSRTPRFALQPTSSIPSPSTSS